jgi:hypothetical protein
MGGGGSSDHWGHQEADEEAKEEGKEDQDRGREKSCLPRRHGGVRRSG